GIAAAPAVLQAFDADGTQVAQWAVTGRIRVELAIPPPRAGDLQRLRFDIQGGGLPVLDDPRILNLRFFRCDWAERETAPARERVYWPTLARLLTSMRASAGTFSTLWRGPGAYRAATRLLEARGNDIFTAGEEVRF